MSEILETTDTEPSPQGNRAGQTQKLEAGAENHTRRPRTPETRILPAEPQGNPRTAPPLLGLTQNEMTWAALAHASILVTLLIGLTSGGVLTIVGALIPAIIWYAFREKSAYVVDQARQAFLFQVAGFVALFLLALFGSILLVVGWVVTAALSIVLIGLLLIPVMLVLTVVWAAAFVALPIGQIVYGCYAALEAYHGRPFRYWWIADLIDRYQSQAS